MTAFAAGPLAPQEIARHVEWIAGAVTRFAAGDGQLGQLVETAERFRVLRAQYQTHPKTMEAHVGRLSALSRQVDGLLERRLAAVVDRYHEVGEEIHRAESEKQFLRDFLIRKAGRTRLELTGLNAELTVQSTESCNMPAAGTDPRKKLEQLIRDTGEWGSVSQLSRVRLEQALKERRFGAHQQAIAQLCPVTTVHRVTSRLRRS